MAIQDNIVALMSTRLGALVRIRENVSAEHLTTFGLGGPAQLVVEPKNVQGLLALLSFLQTNKLTVRLLGAGSNVILPDLGIKECILRLGREFSGFIPLRSAADEQAGPQTLFQRAVMPPVKLVEELKEAVQKGQMVKLFAFGAAPLMGLSRRVAEVGLSGLEFAAGIPGQLGGAVRMNAGAHGSCVAEVLEQALIMNWSGLVTRKDNQQLGFGYRTSNVSNNEIILGAVFGLKPKSKVEVLEQRARCLEYRKKTQPLHLPSAGSVFKNPSLGELKSSKVCLDEWQNFTPSAGWFLEQAGLKGLRCGGVAFAELHANWLVRIAKPARASEAERLIAEAKSRVYDKFGIELKTEVQLWKEST